MQYRYGCQAAEKGSVHVILSEAKDLLSVFFSMKQQQMLR